MKRHLFLQLVFLGVLFIIIFCTSDLSLVVADENSPNHYSQQQPPGMRYSYQFDNNINFTCRSTVPIDLGIDVAPSLQMRELDLDIDANSDLHIMIRLNDSTSHCPPQNITSISDRSEPFPHPQGEFMNSLEMQTNGVNFFHSQDMMMYCPYSITTFEFQDFNTRDSGTQNPTNADLTVDTSYSTYYTINLNASFRFFNLSVPLIEANGLSKAHEYSWLLFNSTSSEWFSIPTNQTENTLSTDLSLLSASNVYQLTIVSIVPNTEEWWTTWWGITAIICSIIFVSAIGLIMSKEQYRSYLLNRYLPIQSSVHRLSMEDVLENDNRTTIINLILEHPGIHFNELLRQTGISAGTLAWHLDILETFKTIWKERVGQYLVYYPYLEKNPFSEADMKLSKSKTTLEIMHLINDNPGIYQNQIAKRMDLNHRTVKYHLNKLETTGLIELRAIQTDNRSKQGWFSKVLSIQNSDRNQNVDPTFS